MAKFNIVLDTRVKKKSNQYNLTVRIVNGNDVMFLNIVKMTKKQYDLVFTKKSMEEEHVKFREDCNTFLSKCERIFGQLKPFNKASFRKLVYQEEKVIPEGLKLSDLFDRYLETTDKIKIRTRDHYKTTKNVLETFKPGITVWDVTPDLLNRFEQERIQKGSSEATASSYIRHLRSLINHFLKVEKLIPESYTYPFGKGGYSVGNYWGQKLVLSNKEIKQIAELNEFDTKEQEYARDIWLFLYRCNGINMADLLRMKWTNIKGDYFVFKRMKTETTRRYNRKDIVVPITPKVRELIDKVGVKDSPFILGYFSEDFNENTFRNKINRVTIPINKKLDEISKKLNLSVELKLKTARDSYATTLKRAGKSKDEISEMLGHSNSVVTEHYLASLDMEKTFDINDCLF
jgi:integrase